MVVEWEQLPSSLYEDIADGNTVYLLPVSSETTYGNSIYPGNYIDLYYSTTVTNSKSGTELFMIGKFIESIKVLAVVDGAGNSVFETATEPLEPSYLMFSVPENVHLLLRKVEFSGGTVFPVPRNEAYSNNPKETRIASAKIQEHIESFALDDNVVAPAKGIEGKYNKANNDGGAE